MPSICTNCGVSVSGKYCSACGQSVEYHLHSLWDLLGEAAEVLTHADSRLWRTLVPLLIRPGFLTQQFLAGRRASYIPPFRLYLVVSVLFFLVVSLTQTPAAQPAISAQSSASPESSISSPTQVNGKSAADLCESVIGHTLLPGANKLRQPFLSACIKSQADNGRELRENFIRNIGRSMFLFLPLLAAFMKLLYWRPRRSYVTHLVLLFADFHRLGGGTLAPREHRLLMAGSHRRRIHHLLYLSLDAPSVCAGLVAHAHQIRGAVRGIPDLRGMHYSYCRTV